MPQIADPEYAAYDLALSDRKLLRVPRGAGTPIPLLTLNADDEAAALAGQLRTAAGKAAAQAAWEGELLPLRSGAQARAAVYQQDTVLLEGFGRRGGRRCWIATDAAGALSVAELRERRR